MEENIIVSEESPNNTSTLDSSSTIQSTSVITSASEESEIPSNDTSTTQSITESITTINNSGLEETSNNSTSMPESNTEPTTLLLNSSATEVVSSVPNLSMNLLGGGDEGELTNASKNDKILSLERQISELNADFGEKRAKFKKLFMQKEEELEQERHLREKIESQMKILQEELNEAKSQVTIAEFTKDSEIEDLKQRGEQEVATLHKLYEESLRDVRYKYEMEFQRLRLANNKLESDLHELRPQSASSGGSEVSPGAVLSAMTKSLARKINSSMSASNDSLQNIEEEPKVRPAAIVSKYAQEDAEILRSLVVQLEEELSALKDKVRNSDDQLAALQNAQASLVKGNDALTVLLQGQNVQGVLTQLDDKLRETRVGLEAEKSSRADLEMYVALVNAQKTLLQEDLDKTKLQLRELRQCNEDEKKRHEDLKETWKKANEHFVQTQDAYQETIHRMKSVMTRQQMEQIKSNDLIISPIASPAEPKPNAVGEEVNVTAEAVVEEKKNEPHVCAECEKYQITIEKLQSDLQKAAKLRSEMEDDWCRISQDLQTKIGSLEEQIGTYEAVLLELNTSCQQSIHDIEKQVKKLIPERDKLQNKLDFLQFENDNLRGKHVAHSEQLQREDISLPNEVMELHEMILRTKEELISVKIGKEEIESELKFFKARVSTEEQEKRIIEESLNNDIKALKDAIRQRDEEIKSKDRVLREFKHQSFSSPRKQDKL